MSATPPRNAGLQSVALMSPMMFSAVANERPPSYTEANRNQTPVQHSPFLVKSEELPTFPSENEITPLTKAQLMQAFNHLLKVCSINQFGLFIWYLNLLNRISFLLTNLIVFHCF